MSKRRNKSRLTKTDVNTICEMQRKIDAYEDFILSIAMFAKNGKHVPAPFQRGTDFDDYMNMAWVNVKELLNKQ